jgi:hypothetical protein
LTPFDIIKLRGQAIVLQEERKIAQEKWRKYDPKYNENFW